YITALVRATREAPALTLGASPRASVALLKLSQAAALLDGRDYVVPDDVKGLATPVLRHRVAVAPELELEGVTPDQALRTILERIEAPRRERRCSSSPWRCRSRRRNRPAPSAGRCPSPAASKPPSRP